MNKTSKAESERIERKLSIAIDKLIDALELMRGQEGSSNIQHALSMIRDARDHYIV